MPYPLREASFRRAKSHSVCQTFFVLLLLGALCAQAQGRARPRIEARGAAVVVNRRVALHFAVRNGGQTPAERARTVADRLEQQALRGFSPGAIQPRHEGRQWSLAIAGRAKLLFVTRADARANQTAPKALAFQWAAQLRSALALPPVTLKPGRIVLPLGETRVLSLGGYAEGAFSSRVRQGESCVGLESREASRRLIVRGEKPGKAVVSVQVGEDEASCVVVVKQWAGRVPTDLTAEVTGTPAAPADLILHAAAAALRRAPREPGASLELLSPLQTHRETRPGESQTLTARVRLCGPNYLPVTGVARVRVFNRDLPSRPAAHLLYSNAPEHIRRCGTLYAAPVPADAPSRLMFHHDNQRGEPVVLAVTLTNPSDHDIKVHLIPGFVPPGGDPATVGYEAGRVFLRNAVKQRGEICTLPARSTLPLLLQRLGRHQTASGIALVALADPEEKAECVLRVAAMPVTMTGFPRSVQSRLDPWRYAAPREATAAERAVVSRPDSPGPVYRAVRTLEARYVVGKQWAFVPLGHPRVDPAREAEDYRGNEGDYGVLYTIQVTIQNPHATPQQVEVAFGAGGGPVMGVFTIGGQVLDISETRPPEQRSLARLTLRPHETRLVTIQTVPLGGSTYPANVIVR